MRGILQMFFLIVFTLCTSFLVPSLAQTYIQQINESKINYLNGESVLVMDLIQNYQESNKYVLKRYLQLKDIDFDSVSIDLQEELLKSAQKDIDSITKEVRYLDSFHVVLDEPYYISEFNYENNSFKLSRLGKPLIPRNIHVGDIGNYPIYYQYITKVPEDIQIQSSNWMINKIFENKEDTGALEVGVSLIVKPEFNKLGQKKGYVTIRILGLNAWYDGKIICSYQFNDREEITSNFTVNGIPITSIWKLLNGKPEPVTESYYPGGQLYSKGSYYDASLTAQNGKFQYFNIEGQLIKEEYFVRGIPEGYSYELYYSKTGISSVRYKYFDNGTLICNETINLISGQLKRFPITKVCPDILVDSLLKSIEIQTKSYSKSSSVVELNKNQVYKEVKEIDILDNENSNEINTTSPINENPLEAKIKPKQIEEPVIKKEIALENENVILSKQVTYNETKQPILSDPHHWLLLLNKVGQSCLTPNIAIDTFAFQGISNNNLPFAEAIKKRLKTELLDFGIFENTNLENWSSQSNNKSLQISIDLKDLDVRLEFDHRTEQKVFQATALLELRCKFEGEKVEQFIQFDYLKNGNEIIASTQREAFDSLSKKLINSITEKILEHHHVILEVADIWELNKDFTPKVLTLNQGKTIAFHPDEYFLIAEKENVNSSSNSISMSKVIGLIRFGTKTGQTVYCSVEEGGIAMKSALEKNRKLMAIPVFQPEFSNKSMIINCTE
jgi:hypothetical protein